MYCNKNYRFSHNSLSSVYCVYHWIRFSLCLQSVLRLLRPLSLRPRVSTAAAVVAVSKNRLGPVQSAIAQPTSRALYRAEHRPRLNYTILEDAVQNREGGVARVSMSDSCYFARGRPAQQCFYGYPKRRRPRFGLVKPPPRPQNARMSCWQCIHRCVM